MHIYQTYLKLVFLVITNLLINQSILADEAASPTTNETAKTIAPTLEDLKNPIWIADGKKRFIQTCAYCHGQEGDAGKTKSFRSRIDWDPQYIHDTIANGRINGANVMPSWKGSIPDETIWKIVSYIRSLSESNKPE